jgi:hypothetical protein
VLCSGTCAAEHEERVHPGEAVATGDDKDEHR